MKKLQHTPEGVRDIYNIECGKKLALENRLDKIFHLYGYHDIQTPTFEYFDVFRKEIGTIPSRDLYKFFDKEGNTLALRPDITPSIARAAATLFGDEELPIRLCYTGNTYVNHSHYRGKLKEATQMGAELIGDDSVEADAEMLALVTEAMTSVGLKEFQLHVGSIGFFDSLIDDAALDEEQKERTIELISNQNSFGVEEYLDSIHVKRSSREAFGALGELVGGVEVLARARDVAPNSAGIMAVKRLENMYHMLEQYGVEKYVTFDLSMTGNYGYYTGIVFRGYTYGTGDAVVRGGRYDHLLEKFGKHSPSIGFGIAVDELMNAMTRQRVRILYTRKNTIVLYDPGKYTDAIEIAKDLRSRAKSTELMKRDKRKSLQDYIRYGNEYYAGTLIYIRDSGDIQMFNLVTGEQKKLSK